MLNQSRFGQLALLFLIAASMGITAPRANAASCLTQAQMPAPVRDALASAARNLLSEVQSGDVQGLRSNTLPAVASDFSGIEASANSLKPLIEKAVITVDALYSLDASTDAPGQQRTDFYCGSPVVVVNFNNLPPGSYALAILHATGVQKPQQVALILAKSQDNHWQLAGFYAKPMLEEGHDGLWYWTTARGYAQKKMPWDAWFYYRIANDLLDPIDFLSSPNLQKLQQESQNVHPENLPGTNPVALSAQGASYQLTAVDLTTEFGGLDLDVHYTPDPTQAAQLRDPAAARKQVMAIMTGLLAQHPELQSAFHGMWVHADQGNATLFALELPMNGIAGGSQPATPLTR